MAAKTEGAARPFHPDDLVVWPDGTCARLEDYQAGHFDWKSDDVEFVRLEETERMRELGLDEYIDE